MSEIKRRPALDVDDFLKMNQAAFFKVTKGRKVKAPRKKPRNREEFLAIGRTIVATIKEAETKGLFQYNPEKGLTIKWKN